MEGVEEMIEKSKFINSIDSYCKSKYGKKICEANDLEILNTLSSFVMEAIYDNWKLTNEKYNNTKKAYYFSAEYLMGRALGNNLINLGIYDEINEILSELNIDLASVEDKECDAGLGNGGLGRLAACFLDSASTMKLPVYGYGIRYKNGLFSQRLINGEQVEYVDEWLKSGELFSIRRDDLSVEVEFEDFNVIAVPYDFPIISYKDKNINTLRLWRAEPVEEFDFNLFNDQMYHDAMRENIKVQNISRVLYPNDSMDEGKMLRLRQQYFMVSASLKDIIRTHIEIHGSNFDKFHDFHVVQLNDTHPALAIPEFIRIMVDDYGLEFSKSINIAGKLFAYTNHTILREALEVWDLKFIERVSRRISEIIKMIDEYCLERVSKKIDDKNKILNFKIIKDGFVHMANMAIHIGFCVNGVAELHTNILKDIELKDWNELYPGKFQNKTNGITPRRWLKLCNRELSDFITSLLGNEDWIKDLKLLKGLEKFCDDKDVLNKFIDIKLLKKKQLVNYIKSTQGDKVNPYAIFDVQVKRMHEYKRQFMNALYILDLYYSIKDGSIEDIPNVNFIFGAKAFPGYARAKAIIKFIFRIKELIDSDDGVRDKINVIFMENYGVSCAEKLFPAADVSKQISTAGKEASGTSNMKFMLNGSITLGTYDGANVEIVREGGEDNNIIFGLKVEGIESMKSSYDSKNYYNNNPNLKRVVDSLIDGTFDDGGTGEFRDLYNSLIEQGDQYFLLADFDEFKKASLKVFEIYKDKYRWAKMCLMNIANSGIFSSDRTISEYANDIWQIEKVFI